MTDLPMAIDDGETLDAGDVTDRIRLRSYALLDISPGYQILDVGCARGRDAQAMAERTGPSGSVVGLDISHSRVDLAREQSAESGLPVCFVQGDVHHLDFPDDAFDGCRAVSTFQDLDDPERALKEMIRVTRAGGRIVVHDSIGDAHSIEGADVRISRRITQYRCDYRLRHGRIGARLPAMFHHSGLSEIVVIPYIRIFTELAAAEPTFAFAAAAAQARAGGIISAAEAEAWLADLLRANQVGEFLCAGISVTVAGRKPNRHI